MSGRYAEELEQLAHTYQLGIRAETDGLRKGITGASQASLIGVGSGGSFTVASFLCSLHEAYTGQVSRASTPLEIICNPTLAASSPAFFVSAEGKNPDITEALVRARQQSARPIHVLTNRNDTPLTAAVAKLRDVALHVFPLEQKDGYLATNSLLLDSLLVARAYDELNAQGSSLPLTLNELIVNELPLDECVPGIARFAGNLEERSALLVLYAPPLRSIAADLESKLSEAALTFVQVADLRSFAHGRHLWLSQRPRDCAVVALVDKTLGDLWDFTASLIPTDIPTLKVSVDSQTASGMVAALVCGLRLVGEIGSAKGKDPGRPEVAPFGSALYYADVAKLVPVENVAGQARADEKLAMLGARWPHLPKSGGWLRARTDFYESLKARSFRAVVFDYDGTLRTTQQEDGPPPALVLQQLIRLASDEVIVAIVSGRGASLQERLSEAMPQSHWEKVHLCLYNGGWVGTVGATVTPVDATSELLNHVSRIANRLKGVGVPIMAIKATHPYQVSIRFNEGVDTEDMWFVLADEIKTAGLDLRGIVRSRHSIDVLSPNVSKSRMIAKIVEQYRISPQQVLAIGDQGAWPGNDAALLEHRWSLSVDLPSRRMDRGWKLAPAEKRGVDATLWYMERMITSDRGYVALSLEDGNVP